MRSVTPVDAGPGTTARTTTGYTGLLPEELSLLEEMQWMEESATGRLLPLTDRALLAVTAVALGLRNAHVPRPVFTHAVAREATLQCLVADPYVLAARLWDSTSTTVAA